MYVSFNAWEWHMQLDMTLQFLFKCSSNWHVRLLGKKKIGSWNLHILIGHVENVNCIKREPIEMWVLSTCTKYIQHIKHWHFNMGLLVL